MKVLVPQELPDVEPIAVEGVSYVRYDVAAPIPAKHSDAEGLVVWANRDFAAQARQLPQLRFVQGLAAGAEATLKGDYPEGVVVSGGSGLHDVTVSEHALAMILYCVRGLGKCRAAQARHQWKRGAPKPQLNTADSVTTLIDARVTIWGYGNIGRELAPKLEAFGARVRGLARSDREEGSVRVYAAGTREEPSPARNDVLSDTDVLVNILPASEATKSIFDAGVFAALPARAYVINVGRGATVDQAALAQALRDGEIAGAALDVTDPEPLPEDSELWDLATLITPHIAGNRPVGWEKLLARNLAAFLAGEEIENRLA